jgi:glycosyltransferase involved in cell wall biosynthesis
MRLLRVIRSVNPEVGGPIEGITQVSRMFRELGHTVELLSLDNASDPWVADSCLKVHAVGRGGRDYGYARQFVPWLRRFRRDYDAVIVSGLWQFQSFGTWLALRESDTPYFVFPHGMLDPWFKRTFPLKHVKKWLYWPWAEYRVLRDASAVLFTCEEERRLARQSFWLYRCNERLVTYGTAAPPGDARCQRELFLQRFPKLRGRRIILCVGRIHPKKGCEILLKAFHAFLAQRPAASAEAWALVYAGPDQVGWQRALGDEARWLGIADRVIFTGMLRGDIKWGAFHAADVFALPSHQENFGIAVVEAMACGLPVIVSTAVNIWREIVDDNAGWACRPLVNDVQQALSHWADLTPGGRSSLRGRARECFARRFEIRRVAESFLTVCKPG